MGKTEEVELTNMCMICDGKGNVLVQDKNVLLNIYICLIFTADFVPEPVPADRGRRWA